MTCDYCSAPILDAALACPACASKITAALTAWQACLLEAIATAERVGLTDNSSEAALIVVRGDDNAKLRLTLRECREEYALTTTTDRLV